MVARPDRTGVGAAAVAAGFNRRRRVPLMIRMRMFWRGEAALPGPARRWLRPPAF